ncbi:lachrymatory-factor synthase-like [Rhodamnia argentea]|uniref:Lachrymatory-factor synthase-like n=1 Tax=Rhodamnia argentea TaxID=178133 RepID=A0ABM3HBH7_9MYRT|nr:lachrymatory-factor synthase-like [Rhodamnia argentea]
MEEETRARWEGKVIAELKGPTPDQVWPLLADFCNLHKWLPTLDTCYRVEGVPGQPGLVRYAAGTANGKGSDPPKLKWVNERLLMTDPSDKCFSYEVLDNNLGFKSYVATIRVMPINDGGDGKMVGCTIELSFVSDPVDGWGLQDMRSFLDFRLQAVAKNIGSAIQEASE